MPRIIAVEKILSQQIERTLAEHGPELFQAAREAGRSIAFEAAIGGGYQLLRQYQNVSQGIKYLRFVGS